MENHTGLTMKKAKELQLEYGKNELSIENKGRIRKLIWHILVEPIYLLLISCAVIYFALGEQTEGAIMMAFVLFVIGIDVVLDTRTGNALKKLKELTTPKVRVIREGEECLLPKEDLVPGDLMLLHEGVKIPADGKVLSSNGLCIDESILTGESVGQYKRIGETCHAGTFVILGSGSVEIVRIGNQTQYGEIAVKTATMEQGNSHLQQQMKELAKRCSMIAAILFVIVSGVTFLNLSDYVLSERIIHSALAGVVLALSMVPGEFPVVLSVFLSMGALRMTKKKALIRRLPAVEMLGAITVLCMDKTGTITQNKLQVAEAFQITHSEKGFCKMIALACKYGTYDPVEKAMLDYKEQLCKECKAQEQELAACEISDGDYIFLKEYPFTNENKAMGQVYKNSFGYLIVAKGSPESILAQCYLSKDQEKLVQRKISEFANNGLRVLALAKQQLWEENEVPKSLLECNLSFVGLLGLKDPLRENIASQMKICKEAGIRILMITGDHPSTAKAIAQSIGIDENKQVITGDEITAMSEEELVKKVKEYNLFARVLPLHKMRIVKALKANGEVVAMTGDGVNDSPAQKMADVGIAMGMHGSEVCREAADVILLDDNFSTILDSIEDGRRIYSNIIKTIGYIFAVHIPIALISIAAPLLGIAPQGLLLLPLHIVLLELVMDPTCSVVLERQPSENNVMKKPPRNEKTPLLTGKLFIRSIIQGLIIFLAAFLPYYRLMNMNESIPLARSVGFSILVISSMLLVFTNCSETETIIHTFHKMRKEKGIWIVNVIILTGLCSMLYSPLHEGLGFAPLTLNTVFIVVIASSFSVLWNEVVKLVRRTKIKRIC